MSWETSDRKSRLPDDWPQLRRIVLTRCEGRCEIIKANGKRCWDKAVEVDHKIAGDDHSLANLQGICSWHHARKSSREGREAYAAKRALRFRPAEPHPGAAPEGVPNESATHQARKRAEEEGQPYQWGG
jgi:hypothetical protein